MFERFTERARQVIVLADDEARRLNHGYIGTEHFLLALIREEEGLAARVLSSFRVELEPVRRDVVRIVGLGDEDAAVGELPLTPRMEKIVELSAGEASAMGHGLVGTEHLLLGLAREGNGVANRILLDHGASSDELRTAVERFLTPPGRD